jgi:hypothetical protein
LRQAVVRRPRAVRGRRSVTFARRSLGSGSSVVSISLRSSVTASGEKTRSARKSIASSTKTRSLTCRLPGCPVAFSAALPRPEAQRQLGTPRCTIGQGLTSRGLARRCDLERRYPASRCKPSGSGALRGRSRGSVRMASRRACRPVILIGFSGRKRKPPALAFVRDGW